MKKPHILVIEDDSVLLEEVQDRLEILGYTYEVAMNFKAAMELFEKNRYDMVLLDLQIPMEYQKEPKESIGISMLHKIREKHDINTLPVIIMTAMGYHLSPSLMSDEKANYFLGKPLQSSGEETLEKLLPQYIEKSRKHKAKALKTDAQEYSFKKAGNNWSIKFGDADEVLVSDLKIAPYVQYLLFNINKKIHVQELNDTIEKVDEKKKGSASSGTVKYTDEEIEILKKERASYEQELDTAKENNYEFEIEELHEKIDAVNNILNTAKGPNGRMAVSDSDVEKFRKRLTRNFDTFLNKIEEQSKIIHKHFVDSIHTGVYFSYEPKSEIYWE